MAKTAKKSSNEKSSNVATGETHSALLKLFTDEIKDIYWAEKHLTKALPKMKKAASSSELQEAFATHLEQTKEHVGRLEQVFELLEKKPQAKKCDAMEGLVQEGESIIEDTDDGTATRDVGLILAAQKVEHYEIATYGGLTQLAKTLGRDDIADLLAETLSEEKETDELLTEIAESNVNYASAEEEA
ncbi:YciE/YciF ferroxidase family protein [Chryseolinea lacunae]|uniref:Ferritin-like domain-containing protein n=1 Tax=Chryseolinea lacunae TaxID=2801331 RepID=A0ABS1KWT3_9BACT|nr:ferritin-like domain-containing protein [Chryseolinea lacunae]MBL0743910.1 ferritin-like domain-containing protein [Chryseolinea lacunae]